MGLSSWQSNLKGGSGTELPPGTLSGNPPNSQMLGYLIGTLGLAAVLIMFPELIPFVLADAAETGAASATAAELASDADVPAWIGKAIANPGDYAADSMYYIQREYPNIYYAPGGPGGPPVYTMPDSELPY
ncbi:MAG TPA: hypothetical protein VGL94_03635 [Ktedonobacteraceae bacterium]